MGKIKILHFIHALGTGGAETLVKEYALNADRDKFEVVVLCMVHRDNSPYEKELMDNGIRVIYMQDQVLFKKSKGILAKAIDYAQMHFLAKKIIKEEAPNVIHSHLLINEIMNFATKGSDAVLVYTVHGETSILWGSSMYRRIDFWYAKRLAKHRNMHFIVLNEKMRRDVNKLFGVRDSIILNNGIDVSKYKKVLPNDIVRNRLGIPKDAFVIGQVGRFSLQKNYNFSVQIFEEISKTNKNAFFLMIGNGLKKDSIEKWLYDKGFDGKFLILSNRDDIPDLLNVMKVFIFPSLYEGLGIALIEAQEAKLPCFISEEVPSHAIISNLVTVLSLKESPKKWAKAILDYKKPAKVVVDDADWDIQKITKELERLYISWLEEKQNGKE